MKYPEPVLQPITDTDDNYRVKEDFTHPTRVGSVTVRAGFISDGASLPINLGWSHWDAETAAAAVLHDGLYESELVMRSAADIVLRETMRRHGCSRFRTCTYLFFVRTLGWLVWRKHTPESVAKARKMVSVKG